MREKPLRFIALIATHSSESLLGILRREGTVWLDTAREDVDSHRTDGLLFSNPSRVVVAETADEVGPLLDELCREIKLGHWIAGALCYEAGYSMEPSLFAPPSTGMLAWFGVYGSPGRFSPEAIQSLRSSSESLRAREMQFAVDPDDYARKIDAIRDLIAEGDVYQINLTAPLRFSLESAPEGLYATLRERQRVSYGAYLNLGTTRILSFSPELFFRLDAGCITTRPMKGTMRRGSSAQSDQDLADALLADEKNRAENLMIVDLLRNDLSKICEVGTVSVPKLFEIERYETVLQMTSTVKGSLRNGVDLADVFKALFPSGSVTGAPKLRAMQRIRELEEEPRGVYCGAIGFASPDGEAVFSVPIRTAVLCGDAGAMQGKMGIGSGVVWDSMPATEHAECLLKARFLTDLAT